MSLSITLHYTLTMMGDMSQSSAAALIKFIDWKKLNVPFTSGSMTSSVMEATFLTLNRANIKGRD